MTNEEIIVSDVLLAGILTQEQVEEYMSTRGEIPVHSYTGWLARGRRVMKGQKACLETKLWKKRKKKDKVEDEKNDDEHKGSFYLTKCFLFTEEQTEKIEGN